MREKENIESPVYVERIDLKQLSATKPIVKPWSRFWARLVDLYLFAYILGSLWEMIDYKSLVSIHKVILGIIILIIWVFVEAFFLSRSGYTLGKWLFGVSVRYADGSKLTFFHAWSRGFRVILRGMAFDIPVLGFFARLFSYLRLQDTGTTAWDTAVSSHVTYEQLSMLRRVFNVCLIICILLYNVWLFIS